MVWAKGKGKNFKGGKVAPTMGWGKGKGKHMKKEPAKVEDDDDDDENEGAVEADDDEEWLAFQSLILQKLVAGGSMSAGKLGHELGAKKKPVAAALFSLAESNVVERSDGIPPKWTAHSGLDESALIDAPVPARFQYDSDKRENAGPRSSRDAFETLKLLVRSHIGGNGATAGSLGYKLNATKKVINAALYACEKEGTAWTLSDPESGVKLRWAGVKAQCNAPLPPCFAYGGATGGADEAQQPPRKKARIIAGGATLSSDDAFEDMKLVCWAQVAAKGDSGVTSGALGFELGADRKGITAALYSCADDGKVQNTGEEGKPPRWVCVQQPPASALSVELPAKFSYKGDKKAANAAAPAAMKRQTSSVAANMSGLTPKQQALLAKKGGGKGAAAAQIIGASANAGERNCLMAINEWCQKSGKALSFVDAGQDAGGSFICQCVVDNEEIVVTSARNKKQAKAEAAAAACEALGVA